MTSLVSRLARWKQLSRRARLQNAGQPSQDVCNFDDAMGIYDHEADDAVDKLNDFQDIHAVFTLCHSVESLASNEDDRVIEKRTVIIAEYNDVSVKMDPNRTRELDFGVNSIMEDEEQVESDQHPYLDHEANEVLLKIHPKDDRNLSLTDRTTAPLARTESLNDPQLAAQQPTYSAELSDFSQMDQLGSRQQDEEMEQERPTVIEVPEGKKDWQSPRPSKVSFSPMRTKSSGQEDSDYRYLSSPRRASPSYPELSTTTSGTHRGQPSQTSSSSRRYPETIHEGEVLTTSDDTRERIDQITGDQDNQNRPVTVIQRVHQMPGDSNYQVSGYRGYSSADINHSFASSIGEGRERIVAQQANYSFNMSAPTGLRFTEVQQHAAFAEVRRFLQKQEYKRFIRVMLRAIKSNSENAVKVMVQILKSFGFDLCEPKFRESIYDASMLHVALLFNRYNICCLLIEEFPGLVTVRYESEKFRNQTAFHIAASNGQFGILDLMLQVISDEAGRELLNTVADGTYFSQVHPEGALALTAAAWSGRYYMLRQLVLYGADLDVKGHRGNTVLHYIVTLSASHPRSTIPKKLFDEVWDNCIIWWLRHTEENGDTEFESENKRKMLQVDAFRYLLSIRNDADQNILSLAVNLHSNLVMVILNIEHVYKQPQTKFGAMSWSTYDITEVTSYGQPNGASNRYNYGSVLHILVHRAKVVTTKEEETYNDLIEEEPILSLVMMKWETYRWVYILWFIIHLFLMVCLTAVSVHFYQPDLNKMNQTVDVLMQADDNTTVNTTWVRIGDVKQIKEGLDRKIYPWYIFFGIIPLIYIILEMIDVCSTGYSSIKSLDTGISAMSSQLAGYILKQWSVTGNAPYRISGFCFSMSVLSWLCLHLKTDDNQDIPLSLAMVFGWLFMLIFTRGCRHICRFSIMMQKMFFQDCLYFISIYIFFWLAFSTAMHVLLLQGDTPGLNVWDTLYGMLNVVTDAGNKASGDIARIPGVAGTLLSIYAVVSVILLLNMLIAMMNTSYEAVANSKTNIWRNQQLSIMLMLERRLWWWVWLCERSQRYTWSPKPKERNRDKIDLGPGQMNDSGASNMPAKRIYLEITQKSGLPPTIR